MVDLRFVVTLGCLTEGAMTSAQEPVGRSAYQTGAGAYFAGRTDEAEKLLSQAIAEHRVFLTCSALDHQTHHQILTNWQRDTAAAAAILTTHNTPPEAIAAFTTAADPAALMPTSEPPWGEVQALCATRPDWQKDYVQLNMVILDLKLVGVLE